MTISLPCPYRYDNTYIQIPVAEAAPHLELISEEPGAVNCAVEELSDSPATGACRQAVAQLALSRPHRLPCLTLHRSALAIGSQHTLLATITSKSQGMAILKKYIYCHKICITTLIQHLLAGFVAARRNLFGELIRHIHIPKPRAEKHHYTH